MRYYAILEAVKRTVSQQYPPAREFVYHLQRGKPEGLCPNCHAKIGQVLQLEHREYGEMQVICCPNCQCVTAYRPKE